MRHQPGRIAVRAITVIVMAHAVAAVARLEPKWSHDPAAGKVERLSPVASVVEDRLAPGGKALRLSYVTGRHTIPGLSAYGLQLAGPVEVRVQVRAQGLTGVAESFRFGTFLRNEETGRVHEGVTLVQPVRVRADRYVTLTFPISITPLPAGKATYALYHTCIWGQKPEEKPSTPDAAVWIAGIDIMGHGEQAPFLSGISPNQTAHRPAEKIAVRVSVTNPTPVPFRGQVTVDEHYGLESTRGIGRERLRLEPGQTVVVDVTASTRGPECGREAVVLLRDAAGVELDSGRTYYGVARDPSVLATVPLYSAESGHRGYHSVFYVGPGSLAHSRTSVRYYQSRYLQRAERFSWSYNELAQFLPPRDEEPYLGNEGIWWQSLKKIKAQNRMLREIGITPITYINGHLWGPAAYDLYQKHPEWFVYSRNGELKGNTYDMENRANYMRRREFEFVQVKRPFFYGNLIPTLPECRRHIADQIISTAREMGFEGARWDVWSMEIKPGDYTLDGRSLADSWPEADRLTAESMAALKAMVAKEVPNFTWGYNYASPAENKHLPLTLAEKCRGGGWLLDEVICGYQEKTSPFHYWEAYRDRIVGWGDQIRKRGGIYNPFAFRRGGGKYAVDRLYEGIFRLIGGGRSSDIYENEAGLVGRIGLMALRYNTIFNGWDLELQGPAQTGIRVTAPDTLWWKTMVFRNTGLTGRPQMVVHLVNSPVATEVEENPTSEVRPPVQRVAVHCATLDRKFPRKAWIVTAEPMLADGVPAVQAVPMELSRTQDGANVTVPSVLYWKTVVFEY